MNEFDITTNIIWYKLFVLICCEYAFRILLVSDVDGIMIGLNVEDGVVFVPIVQMSLAHEFTAQWYLFLLL